MKLHTLIHRAKSVIGAILIAIASVVITYPQKVIAFSVGDGSEGSPYTISSCEEFADINDDPYAHYELMTNLECTSMGNTISVTNFYGFFDGNNHTIQIALNESNDSTGLFGGVLGATINNLRVSGTVVATNQFTGLFAGSFIGSTASNVIATGSVSSSSHLVGGLIGVAGCNSTVTESHANVSVEGDYIVGGFVGADSCEGGGSYSQSSAVGQVVGGSHVGGFIGEANDSNVSRSYSSGGVTGEYRVGGFVGYSRDSEFTQSFTTSNVEGNTYIGGFIGETDNNNIFTDVYARGSATGGVTVGGFLGWSAPGTQITNGYATGLVSADSSFGGFIGPAEGGTSVQSSFWDTQTTGTENGGDATGKTTLEMKSVDTYTDESTEGLTQAWDFEGNPSDDDLGEDIWAIHTNKNDGYPCLRWSEVSCQVAYEDYNDDGINDSGQSNLSSYLSPITGKRVVIDVGDGCEITKDDIGQESVNDAQDIAYDYTNGMFDFAGDCGDVGYTTTVKLYYYDVRKDNLIVRKYNPHTNAYFNLTGAHGLTLNERIVDGQVVTVTSYQITDGGDLDMDLEENGEFEDPVGLAGVVLGAPNTGIKRQ